MRPIFFTKKTLYSGCTSFFNQKQWWFICSLPFWPSYSILADVQRIWRMCLWREWSSSPDFSKGIHFSLSCTLLLGIGFFGGDGARWYYNWEVYNSKKKKERKKKMQYLLLFRYIIFAKADLWMIHWGIKGTDLCTLQLSVLQEEDFTMKTHVLRWCIHLRIKRNKTKQNKNKTKNV